MSCTQRKTRTLSRTAPQALLMAGAALLLGAGCQQAELEATQTSLDKLSEKIATLDAQLADSRRAIDALGRETATSNAEVDAHLIGISERMQDLPGSLQELCPEPAAASVQCENTQRVQRVLISADKMLVGELEHVWIDPPGVTLVARIDTGATSSSLHAENVLPFERDGEDWVRFDMVLDAAEPITVERQVIRHARVFQQADPDGSRRHVVAMRVRLGDVQDTFEFTLADRSHLENDMILGRNFLADVTLVDVGNQFIQPRYSPSPEP